jgi:hypothetical protein
MNGSPGFVADRSIYRTTGQYNTCWQPRQAGVALPAFVDPTCFANCYDNCTWDCGELVGTARSRCLANCRDRATACRASCETEAPPPPPPPPPPSICTSGGLCMTAAGTTTCACPPGEICRPRCGPQICEVNWLLCLLFPPVGCLPQCQPGLCTTDSFCQPA